MKSLLVLSSLLFSLNASAEDTINWQCQGLLANETTSAIRKVSATFSTSTTIMLSAPMQMVFEDGSLVMNGTLNSGPATIYSFSIQTLSGRIGMNGTMKMGNISDSTSAPGFVLRATNNSIVILSCQKN